MPYNSLLSDGIYIHGYSSSDSLKWLSQSNLKDPLNPFRADGADLTIVVLSFNRVSFTIRLIDSVIRSITGFQGRILIMDNGSSADQLEKLEKKIGQTRNFPIDLVKLGKNHGVAGGRNEAMKHVKTDWFLSLDNDIYLIGNPLPSIKKAIDNLGVLFLNVPLLQIDSLTIDAFGGNLWMEPYEDSYFISGTSTFKQLQTHELPHMEPFVSTFLFGGASVINRKAFLEHGGYDSNMFIGFEDTELSLRLVKKGIKIGNATDFCFIHAHQPPRTQDDIDAEKARFSARVIRESGEYFKNKHGLTVWRSTVDDWIEDKFKELKIGDASPVKIIQEGKKVEVAHNGETQPVPQVVNGVHTVLPQDLKEKPTNGHVVSPVSNHVEELRRKLESAHYRIQTMESSKFWKLRQYWFRFRKAVGVANDGFSIFNKQAFVPSLNNGNHKTLHRDPYDYSVLLKKAPYKFKGSDNVLVFIPYMVIGGAETAILQVLKGLRKNRINASLIVSAHSNAGMGDTSRQFYETCPDSYVLEDYNNLWNDSDSWKHWRNLTIELIRKRNIQTILISNSSFAYLLLDEIRNLFPHIKVLNPVYSTVGHMEDNLRHEHGIDLTIVENPLVEEFLVADRLRDPARVKRIENGVDIKKFRPAKQKGIDKINNISLPAGKKIITFLGRLSEEKGPDLFIEIAAQLKARTDLHFLVAGDGPMKEEVIARANELQVADRVSFIGYADSFRVLSATCLLILPSRIDGRPNVVLESLAMGVPVIASKVGGLPWLVGEEYGTGVCCEAGDIKSFASAIEMLADNRAQYDRIRKSSRKFAIEKLDVDMMQRSYANLCRI